MRVFFTGVVVVLACLDVCVCSCGVIRRGQHVDFHGFQVVSLIFAFISLVIMIASRV